MQIDQSFIFDPQGVSGRRRDMFAGLDTEATRVRHTFVSASDAVTGPTGMDEKDGQRMLWVSHMNRIRDKKDKEAFGELFGHFAPRVKGFLMKSGVDGALAEECAQEVLATCWQKAHMFDATRASVATWIFTIARNRKIDVLRKQRRPEPEHLGWGPEEDPDQADVLALQQETEILGRAIAELPIAQRELIEKAYFGDMSHSEIAARTGLPLGTIKSRIRLALERLRHAMK
jgi:RNA polymerase sigma-70 factor, ECF subfamily